MEHETEHPINFISRSDYGGFKEKVDLYKGRVNQKVEFNFNFSIKLDSKWVDLFWRKGSEDFDNSMMSFFTRFLSCRFVVDSASTVTEKEMQNNETIADLYTNTEKNLKQNKYFGFGTFGRVLSEHPENLFLLDKVLDTLWELDITKKNVYTRMIPEWEKSEEKTGDDFYRNASTSNTHIKMIALSAFISFVNHMPDFNMTEYDKWMRVVWNVIENTNVDNLSRMSSLMRKFEMIAGWIGKQMREKQSDFYSALSTYRKADASEVEIRAVLEEVEKARRIAEDTAWEDAFMTAEKHPYFKGMVSFYYTSDMDVNDFKWSYTNAAQMFDENGITDYFRKDHILIRAIVSQLYTWGDLNGQYITERAETNKYLKNLLASNKAVQKVITDATCSSSSKEEIICSLENAIVNAPAAITWPGASDKEKWGFENAVDSLRSGKTMYDWLAEMETTKNKTFRVYWYEGHVMLAQRSTTYARIAHDTERAFTGRGH